MIWLPNITDCFRRVIIFSSRIIWFFLNLPVFCGLASPDPATSRTTTIFNICIRIFALKQGLTKYFRIKLYTRTIYVWKKDYVTIFCVIYLQIQKWFYREWCAMNCKKKNKGRFSEICMSRDLSSTRWPTLLYVGSDLDRRSRCTRMDCVSSGTSRE